MRVLEAWHIWVIVGVVLWIVEVFTLVFVAGVFGTACLIVALFAAQDVPFGGQLLVFGLATAVLTLKIRPLALRYLHRHGAKVKTNVEALIGKTGVVTGPADHPPGSARVKLGAEEWLAITPDGSALAAGTKVVIRQVEGCTLVVEQAEKP